MLLRELSDRLHEHNFDPELLDSKNGMKLAISEFQTKSNMTRTGEATEGVLMRLRRLNDLKPWGSIVYGPETTIWNLLGLSDASGGRCGGTGQLRFSEVCKGTRLLRHEMRGLCDFRKIMVADPAGYDPKCQGCRS